MPSNYEFVNHGNLNVNMCVDGSSVDISIDGVPADGNPVTAAADGSFSATFASVPISGCGSVALSATGMVTAPNTYSVNVTSGEIGGSCYDASGSLFESLQINTIVTVVLFGDSGCPA